MPPTAAAVLPAAVLMGERDDERACEDGEVDDQLQDCERRHQHERLQRRTELRGGLPDPLRPALPYLGALDHMERLEHEGDRERQKRSKRFAERRLEQQDRAGGHGGEEDRRRHEPPGSGAGRANKNR
jgi:hypothetical protein